MFVAVIAGGDDYYRQTFQQFRPGFDLALERLRRSRRTFSSTPMSTTSTRMPGPAGEAAATRLPGRDRRNQTARAERLLHALDLPTSSARRTGKGSGSRLQGVLPPDHRRMQVRAGRDRLRGRPVGQRHPPRRLPRGWSPRSCGAAPWGYPCPHPDVAQAHLPSSHFMSCPNAWHRVDRTSRGDADTQRLGKHHAGRSGA